ncbi:DEAD/DEAH box helicase [Niveispirillum lacus]|uniref:DEAD/DEAH box helicase n=1 Tax=Niveispirillum lacus TaxID=1981099 RepID=UPI0013FDDDA2|nr:DEAD/DEAH box helicase [Niveispirillum lacus]
MTITFSELALPAALMQAVAELGYVTPTPIQAQAIPAALEGKDVVASANTGTGKTAAFVLPALARIAASERQAGSWGPRVLVLTPTRELASQVLDQVRLLSKFGRIQTGTVLGGMPYRAQIEMLRRRADLIVATPGRLIDHLENGKVDLSCVEMLVLDEADRMLDMGFRDAVEQISNACPADRQTLLFTATLDRTAEKLASALTKDPVRVDVAGKAVTNTSIEQRWLRADGLDHKHKLLGRLLEDEAFGKGIIFMATKADCDVMADQLSEQGHRAMPLHGDMQQRERNRVVQWLRDGRINVLVATDVAARGIDISDLSHVINFDLPRVAEDYVHRIGRTGRAGATGVSYSLFTRHDRNLVRAIEQYTGQPHIQTTLPGLEPMPEPERSKYRPGGAGGHKPYGARSNQAGKPYGNKGGFGGQRREGGWGGERREGGYQGGGERREGGFRAERQDGGYQGGERREGGFRAERRDGGYQGGEQRSQSERLGGWQGERREAQPQGGDRPQRAWTPDASPVAGEARAPHPHKANPYKPHAGKGRPHGHGGEGRADFRDAGQGGEKRREFRGERQGEGRAEGREGGAAPLRRPFRQG